MIDVQSVAKYIINYSNDINHPVSNLKLQKLLYFLWVDYFKKTREYLFNDSFYAWQFGPVIPNIYYAYCTYGALPISKITYNTSTDFINSEDKIFIKKLVDKYQNYSALQLVNQAHKKGLAWDRTFENGFGNRKRIKFEDIIRFDCFN